jgi:hypothetical protein
MKRSGRSISLKSVKHGATHSKVKKGLKATVQRLARRRLNRQKEE